MTTTTLEAKVHDFLAQKRIAVAGVSRDNSDHPVGNLIYRRLKTTGHDVFPVNPHMQTFEGERCYPDVQSIPGGVDGVVIITRPVTTERIVRECDAAGVRRVWMHQSMGTRASSVSAEAVEYCRQHDISVIAGACPMMFGPGADLGHTCMRWLLKLTGGLPAQTLLVGNTVALLSAMTYDKTVNAIGPFELTEYLGLALVWGALAVTAPFPAPSGPVPATR